MLQPSCLIVFMQLSIRYTFSVNPFTLQLFLECNIYGTPLRIDPLHASTSTISYDTDVMNNKKNTYYKCDKLRLPENKHETYEWSPQTESKMNKYLVRFKIVSTFAEWIKNTYYCDCSQSFLKIICSFTYIPTYSAQNIHFCSAPTGITKNDVVGSCHQWRTQQTI